MKISKETDKSARAQTSWNCVRNQSVSIEQSDVTELMSVDESTLNLNQSSVHFCVSIHRTENPKPMAKKRWILTNTHTPTEKTDG